MNRICKLFIMSVFLMCAFGCKKNSGANMKKIVLDSERNATSKEIEVAKKDVKDVKKNEVSKKISTKSLTII